MIGAPQPEAPRLYLDENVPPELALQLRELGFDIVAAREVGLLHATDNQQLAYAAATRRAIVTFDTDDYPLLNTEYLMAGQEHWGIVLSTRRGVSTDTMRYRLLRLLATTTAEDLRNQIRWLNDFK